MSSNSVETLHISTSDDSDQLRSLLRWLRVESALKGNVEAASREIEPGHMGVPLDAIIVAIGSGGTLVALARSLSTWITHRRSDIRLTIRSADGRTVELDAKRVDPESVTRQLSQLTLPTEEGQ